MELTRSEMEIMDMLWQADKPLSRADLMAWPGNKRWKDGSVHILLNGLLGKGAIHEAGFVKRCKTYGRTFLPSLTREEYFINMIFGYAHQPEVVPLIKAILNAHTLTPEEQSQLKTFILSKYKG